MTQYKHHLFFSYLALNFPMGAYAWIMSAMDGPYFSKQVLNLQVGTKGSCAWQRCYGCNTKSTQYSGYSGNVPGLHILLRVKLLTLFTSGLPFLLCSSFVLTLLIREHRLVVLSFRSIVLRSQTYLQSVTPNSLLCPLSGYSACCAP